MKEVARWYDRENWPYASDRGRLAQYANWLNRIPWMFFCTLTFAWQVSDPQAEEIYKEFNQSIGTCLGMCRDSGSWV